ncbi:MAG TPA: phosphatase PAP2 family protein [Methylotenera sp.]|nr:phosphatase PAP2 family protein [Methylotenera sp.]HPH04580.1 phosphatase PAP2 family protein [Methylotenera sp.]HPN00745.1 phosphatase PAP2 family protein [Methylotenera sp.]
MFKKIDAFNLCEQLAQFGLWLKLVLPAVLFAMWMVWGYANTSWDMHLTNLFFDAQHQQFYLRHQSFLSDFMHVGLKWLMVAVALLSFMLGVLAYKLKVLKPIQRPLFWAFAGTVVSSSTVAMLKHSSMHGCPWDLAIYGGDLPYLPLFSSLPDGVQAGACFPAGHPSGGFALMAFYFAFRQIKPQFAVGMLWLGVFFGLAMGFAQVMRGAHFLSHVLWSGWVVWVALLLLYLMWPPIKVGTNSNEIF